MSRIRENPDFKSIQVIGISGYTTPEEEAEMIETGFSTFVRKPIRVDDLIKKVRDLVRR